jgi:tetratricopeptide (TPR) repeat protein
MLTRKSLLIAAMGLNLISLVTGCHVPPRDTSLLVPINDGSTAMRAGAKEPELPAGESAKLCFTTAETLEKGGKDGEAIGLYEKARLLDKHLNTEVTRRLAVLYDRCGEFDKALDEYRRGLTENPKDAELLSDLGYGYYNRGQWTEAEKNLRKAVAANPKFANAWINLGMTLAQQYKYEESLQAFGKVVPKAQALCNLAFIQATQSKFDEARKSYEAALNLEPGLQIARTALHKLNQPSTQPAPSRALPTAQSPRVQPEHLTALQPDLSSRPVEVRVP